MDKLVKLLLDGEHPVLLEPRIKDYDKIKERLQKTKFVIIKFIDTVGETELGINVDENLSSLNDTDFRNRKNTVCIVGTCELNYQRIRITATVNLSNKKGRAKLKII